MKRSALPKVFAVVLIAAFLAATLPSPTIAGGCDEPGYTGGNCTKKDSTSPKPPVTPVPPDPPPPHPKPDRQEAPSPERTTWVAWWLSAILGGLIR